VVDAVVAVAAVAAVAAVPHTSSDSIAASAPPALFAGTVPQAAGSTNFFDVLDFRRWDHVALPETAVVSADGGMAVLGKEGHKDFFCVCVASCMIVSMSSSGKLKHWEGC